MKRTILLLLAITMTFCDSKSISDRKYKLKVKDVSIERLKTGNLIDPYLLRNCLSKYAYHNTLIQFFGPNDKNKKEFTAAINEWPEGEAKDKLNKFGLRSKEQYMASKKENRNVYDIDMKIYDNLESIDKRYKRGLEGSATPFCAKYLDYIKDGAFILDLKRCPQGPGEAVTIIYSNAMIDISVFPYGEIGAPPDELNEYNKVAETLMKDFINDFYPYLLKCAEQAKVPVTSESKK